MSDPESFNVAGYFDPHRHSMEHRAEIEASSICGCFHCRKTFPPGSIKEWVDEDQTALCPKCGIDAVIGDASGVPVGEPGFLNKMRQRWFTASH